MQNEIWERFGSFLFSSDDEDRPVPPDYTFSFTLEPQRRAVYEHEGRFYPSPPRFVNPWRVSKMVDDISETWSTLDYTDDGARRGRKISRAELDAIRELGDGEDFSIRGRDGKFLGSLPRNKEQKL